MPDKLSEVLLPKKRAHPKPTIEFQTRVIWKIAALLLSPASGILAWIAFDRLGYALLIAILVLLILNANIEAHTPS